MAKIMTKRTRSGRRGSPPAKRMRLTKMEQRRICEHKDAHPSMSLTEPGTWAYAEFSLEKPPAKSTISKILRSKEELNPLSVERLEKMTTLPSAFWQLEQSVVEFVIFCEMNNTSVTGHIIMVTASRLAAELGLPRDGLSRFTKSWMRHFMAHYGLRRRRSHGESSSVDEAAVQERIKALRVLLQSYEPSNIFNADKTVYFYKTTPRTSICRLEVPALKQSKARVTMLVGANADGSEKLPLLFLGTATSPRWLSEKPAEIQYGATAKGWMTVAKYQEWLLALEADMLQRGRRILLLVDNAPVHVHEGLLLEHVRVAKLPPNTTATIQPMDQGVIANLKIGIMNLKAQDGVDRLFDGEDPYSFDLLTAMMWGEEAWANVTTTTIRNCWRHSRLLPLA